MNITPSPDGRTARINIALPAATAEDVENMIHQLATARQEMLPEVPRYTPKWLTAIDEPDVKRLIGDDGRLTFAIRCAGLGWLQVRFSLASSHATIVACAGAAREMKLNSDIFGPSAGEA